MCLAISGKPEEKGQEVWHWRRGRAAHLHEWHHPRLEDSLVLSLRADLLDGCKPLKLEVLQIGHAIFVDDEPKQLERKP